MHLKQALSLIQHALPPYKTRWAELGCGDGLFTNALSQLLIDGSELYVVDKNKRALNNVVVRNEIKLERLVLDFVKDELPFKDISGILMANAFHFVKDKHAFIRKIFNYLNSDGYLLIVEYNRERSNLWVPYPISFDKLQNFFADYRWVTKKLHEAPSAYQGSIYSAIVRKKN